MTIIARDVVRARTATKAPVVLTTLHTDKCPYRDVHPDVVATGLARLMVLDTVLVATTVDDAEIEHRNRWAIAGDGIEPLYDLCWCLDGETDELATTVSLRALADQIAGELVLESDRLAGVRAIAESVCMDLAAEHGAASIFQLYVGADSTPLIRPTAVDWIRQDTIAAVKAEG